MHETHTKNVDIHVCRFQCNPNIHVVWLSMHVITVNFENNKNLTNDNFIDKYD